jgi:hypothetical protein
MNSSHLTQPAEQTVPGECDATTRGMAIYARAKDAAMERAALAAYNAHFFKCTPSCSVADWTTAWKKAVCWWTEPATGEQA